MRGDRARLEAAVEQMRECDAAERELLRRLEEVRVRRTDAEEAVYDVVNRCEEAGDGFSPRSWRRLLRGLHSGVARAIADVSLRGRGER